MTCVFIEPRNDVEIREVIQRSQFLASSGAPATRILLASFSQESGIGTGTQRISATHIASDSRRSRSLRRMPVNPPEPPVVPFLEPSSELTWRIRSSSSFVFSEVSSSEFEDSSRRMVSPLRKLFERRSESNGRLRSDVSCVSDTINTPRRLRSCDASVASQKRPNMRKISGSSRWSPSILLLS